MESPCRRMCTLNDDDLCLGCGRLLHEITAWTSYNAQQRAVVSEECKRRLMDLANENSTLVGGKLEDADK
ncbi:hypothetical protein A9Q82_03500 [Cycloclasticus sp. 46_120_T64]|nr:hypothetical protein A9Q82_03500 [Cycloclasticus sp. 46_120_T64]